MGPQAEWFLQIFTDFFLFFFFFFDKKIMNLTYQIFSLLSFLGGDFLGWSLGSSFLSWSSLWSSFLGWCFLSGGFLCWCSLSSDFLCWCSGHCVFFNFNLFPM